MNTKKAIKCLPGWQYSKTVGVLLGPRRTSRPLNKKYKKKNTKLHLHLPVVLFGAFEGCFGREEKFLYYFSLLLFFSSPFLFSLNWDSWRGCDLCLVFYEPEGNNNNNNNRSGSSSGSGSDNNNKEPVVGLFAIKRVMSQMQIAHPVHFFMMPYPLHSAKWKLRQRSKKSHSLQGKTNKTF